MKISFRTHPILEKIYKGSFDLGNGFSYLSADKQFIENYGDYFFNEVWNSRIPEFKQEINHVSDSFIKSYCDNVTSIKTLLDERIGSEIYDPCDPLNLVRGTYLIGDFIYTVHLEQKIKYLNGVVFGFDRCGIPIFAIIIEKNSITEWFSNGLQNEHHGIDVVLEIWGLAVYKRYAEVETVIVLPNSKKKYSGIKQVNDTRLEICYLDSKWFRNIVRNEEFTVKGHIRLQRFGKGRTIIKPIWIAEFLKHGCKIQARKQRA